MKSCICFRI